MDQVDRYAVQYYELVNECGGNQGRRAEGIRLWSIGGTEDATSTIGGAFRRIYR